MFEKLLSTTIVVAALVILYFITNLFFTKVVIGRISKRKETIILLIINIVKYIALIISVFVVLSIFGVDTTSVLAGAGLVGILLGFALQKLLQDMINGFFIILENQYIVGEYVEINGRSGCVIELGLKTTKIINHTGEVFIISNGVINEVVNYSRNNSLMIIDLCIMNKNKYQKVCDIVEEVLRNFSHHNITSVLQINGIQDINEFSYKMRITCKTLPYSYFEVARMLRVELIKTLQENDIEFMECVIVK